MNDITQGLIELNDNGAWSWFMDERVIVHQGKLLVGSPTDNLRPIIPIWDDPRVALVWMRGRYHSNRGPWDTKVVAAILPRSSV